MNRLRPREGTRPATIPPGVWIAVGVAGGIILIALICMIFLLVRATRAHKRLLADLEQRGIRLGQQHVQIDGNGVTKPRQVLRRNVFLPYNNTTGWGVLPSKESFGQSSLNKTPRTTQTPTIIEPVPDTNQTAHKKVWPFHKRRNGPKHIKMDRLRTSRLSAIIESPKPMLDISSPKLQEERESTPEGPPRLTLDPICDSPIEKLCPPSFGSTKPNSAPDLTSALRPAPLFSSPVPAPSGTVIRSPKRRGRSNSVPSIYSTNEGAREIHPSNGSQKLGRNFSLIYRQSGLAPENPVPPLPLRFGHARSVSNVDYSPSRRSASSFESATSSILVTTSPDTQRSPHARMRQSPGHELHKSLVLKGPRPMPQLRADSSSPRHFRDESIRSNVAQFAMEIASSDSHSRNGSPESKAGGKLKIESNSMGRLSQRSRSNNSLMGGAPSTPRRNSRTLVSSEGSPTERCRFATHQDVSAHEGILAQQLSRTSTNASSSCSSNGNPFRWDPTPMQSGKSSGPRTSPDKKRSHRRQNCIRLSLTTGQVGPPVKPEDPTVMHGIEEEPGSMHRRSKPSEDGEMISLDTRPLPRPPSINVFSPDIHLSPTTIRASLTQESPTLSLTKYNQENCDGSPRWRCSGISGASAFSIPTFPSPANTDCSQTALAHSGGDAISCPDANGEERAPKVQEYNSDSPLNYPVLTIPSPEATENKCRPTTPPGHERRISQIDSPPCSPKTLLLNSIETTPVDLCKMPKLMSSTPPVPELPPRDPRRSKEISSPTRAGLTGPRAEPGRDLRKTVAALRRMNSDAADDSRTSRRYRQLGREPTSNNLVVELENTTSTEGGDISSKNGRSKYTGGKAFSSPSKHFVPASTYSLVAPSPHNSVAPSTMSTNTDSVAASSAFSATTGRTSTTTTTTTTTAPTTPPAIAAIQKPPAFGLGLSLGGGSGVGGGLGCSSASNNSLTLSTRSNGIHFLGGGDDSCTSLTDLILAENENIFGRKELELANPDRPGSSVWEDGEGFWESPSAKEREIAREKSSSSLSVYATACGSDDDAVATTCGAGVDDPVTATSGAGGSVVGGVRTSSEFYDSDAENKTPTGKNGASDGVAVGKEEGKRRRWTERGGGDKHREVLAPKVLISVRPPSEQGTPGSLYDQDGFLK